MTRWSKGTTDHDGDGKMGGSLPADRSDKGQSNDPSRSDLAPDPEKEDSTMAKAPTKKADDTSTENKAAGGNGGGTKTPSQPWAQPKDEPVGSAEELKAASDAAQTVVTSTEDIPSTDASEIPGMGDEGEGNGDVDTNATHEQAERSAENDVAQTAPRSELPSFVRDQITPSGVDVPLEMDRSTKPALERSAYPSVGEKLNHMIAGASPEITERFYDRMLETAHEVIEELRGEDTSRDFTSKLVDGTRHYGPAVRSDAAQKASAVVANNAERNRRARRAAERAQRASQAERSGK